MTTFTTPTRHTDRTAGLHYAETPVRQRAILTCGSWRRVTRRIVCGLTCALTVSSLLMPSISFAAEWVEVDGNTYTAGATAGDGSTWAWDGADDMTLNGYNGEGIAAGGKLNVSYEGNNTVANDEGDGISVVNGTNESAELNISGTGTLTATAEGDALHSGRSAEQAPLTPRATSAACMPKMTFRSIQAEPSPPRARVPRASSPKKPSRYPTAR